MTVDMEKAAHIAIRRLTVSTAIGSLKWKVAADSPRVPPKYTAMINDPDWTLTLTCVDRDSPTLIVCDRWSPSRPWVFPNDPAIIDLLDVVEKELRVTSMAEGFFAALGEWCGP